MTQIRHFFSLYSVLKTQKLGFSLPYIISLLCPIKSEIASESFDFPKEKLSLVFSISGWERFYFPGALFREEKVVKGRN